MEKTKNLSWKDVLGILKVNNDRAKDVKAMTLVGRLPSGKIFPKLVIFPLIKVAWHFALNLKIEDADPNQFLISF